MIANVSMYYIRRLLSMCGIYFLIAPVFLFLFGNLYSSLREVICWDCGGPYSDYLLPIFVYGSIVFIAIGLNALLKKKRRRIWISGSLVALFLLSLGDVIMFWNSLKGGGGSERKGPIERSGILGEGLARTMDFYGDAAIPRYGRLFHSCYIVFDPLTGNEKETYTKN